MPTATRVTKRRALTRARQLDAVCGAAGYSREACSANVTDLGELLVARRTDRAGLIASPHGR
jgi:hypothetical protein